MSRKEAEGGARGRRQGQTNPTTSGLLLLTDKHWSRMYIDSDQPRPDWPNVAKPTDAEMVAMWRPFVAGSGTYEVSGNTVTCRALIAKNPSVMAPGNFASYTFKIEGNTLTLIDTRSNTGPAARPRTFTYIRLE